MQRTELHGHSIYSVGDSIATISKIVAAAKAEGHTAIALTDHGYMYSMVKFVQECEKHKIKPIIGLEAYYVPDRSLDPTSRFHLVLLAKNEEGLKNIYRIASDAGMNLIASRAKEYPRTEDATLQKYGKGVIALSACLGGLIPKLIVQGEYDKAKAKAIWFSQIFEEFYLELQPHDVPEQLIVNQGIMQIAQETGIKMVMTSDYHYIEADHKPFHDVLMSVNHRNPFSVSAHFRKDWEMEYYCKQHGIPLDVITNSQLIADGIDWLDPRPQDARGLMPPFPCPPGFTEESYLRHITMKKMWEYLEKSTPTYSLDVIKRVNYELDIICSMGFAGYFLILWDWFDWCRSKGILIGKGRGSAAGSEVSYLLKITSMDPIKNGYFFERFLNPERIEFPDVDSDIPKDRRAEAIDYLLQKYGQDYVSQIITFSFLKLKSTLKKLADFYKMPYEEINEITRQIPDMLDGDQVTLELVEDISFDPEKYVDKYGPNNVSNILKINVMINDLFAKFPFMKDAFEHLKGCIANTGIHAGGVIVSGKPLYENVPIRAGSGTAVLPLVQFSMEDLDFFKALKIDALGLSTLTQIKYCMDLVGLDMEWFESEDFDDPKVYEMLRNGFTCDVFQMSSFNATKMVKDMKVSNIEDLTVVNAGNRPGPLSKDKDTGKSLVDEYIENNNSGIIPKIHPDVDKILVDTKGCIWYQEQVMAISRLIAGYSLGAADSRIRKTLGKKKVELIPELKAEFLYGKKYDNDAQVMKDESSKYCKGAIGTGFDITLGEKIFDTIAKFAKYSFNKPHSGCYAAVAFKTAWQKCHYPHEFTISCLATHDQQSKKIATISEARRMGIKILPPDINKSKSDFSIEIDENGNKCLRYGLSAIQRVGESVYEFLDMYRPFVDFDDYYTKIHNAPRMIDPLTGKAKNNPLNKSVEINLIKAGAFDSMNTNRYDLLNYYSTTLRRDKDYTALDSKQFKLKQKLELELEVTGVYLSEHPLERFPYQNPDELVNNDPIEIAGIIKSISVKKTKAGKFAGKDYCTFQMETKDGRNQNVLVFAEHYDRLNDRIKKDQIIVVRGVVNKKFNNITANDLLKIVRQQKPKENPVIDIPVKEIDLLGGKLPGSDGDDPLKSLF